VFNVVRHTRQLDVAVAALIILGVIEGGIGALAWGAVRYQWTGPLWSWLTSHSLTQGTSVSSTLQYRNTFAAFVILPFFLCLTRTLDTRAWWKRALYGILAVFFVVMVILSQSRGGLLTLLISLAVFPAALPRQQRGKGMLAVLILAAALALLFWLRRDTFVPMLVSLVERIRTLVAFVGGVQDASLYARVVMIRDAARMSLHRPVLGTGAGTYQYVYTEFRSIPFYAKFPHSIVVEQLVEVGFVGCAAFLAMTGCLLWRGVRIARREQTTIFAGLLMGAFANILHAAVDFDWSLLAMPLVFFVTCGLLVSRQRREPKMATPHVAMGRSGWTYPVRLLTGVAGVMVVWFVMFAVLLSSFNTNMAQRAQAAGDLAVAQYRYRTAARLAPLGAEQKADLAQFLRDEVLPVTQDPDGVQAEVQDLYEQAVRLNPRMWAYHDALARVCLARGETTQALREAQAAVDRNPLRADEWFLLAVASDRAGDMAGSARALDRGLSLQEAGSS
jgi:O-antigen ligase